MSIAKNGIEVEDNKRSNGQLEFETKRYPIEFHHFYFNATLTRINMSEDKKEPWLNYLGLMTVILAVCATLSTFKGGSYSTRSVISQAQASDQWAFFQAKSIRQSLYLTQKDKLQLEADLLPPGRNQQAKRYQTAIDGADAKISKYEKEKSEIQLDARRLEKQRDEAQRHAQPFGLAVIFLQVAILISSIAGLLKRKAIWYVALPIGVLGLFYFADGFMLFM